MGWVHGIFNMCETVALWGFGPHIWETGYWAHYPENMGKGADCSVQGSNPQHPARVQWFDYLALLPPLEINWFFVLNVLGLC